MALQFLDDKQVFQVYDESAFAGKCNSAWSLFFDFEYDGNAGESTLFLCRAGAERMQCSVESQNIAVNNGSGWTSGTTTLAASTRYRTLLIYDGTTLKCWLKPDASGSITEEINTTVSFTNTNSSGVSWGGQRFNNFELDGIIYDGCFWDAALDEDARFGLLEGVSPRMYQPADMFWYPDPYSGSDLSGNHTTLRDFGTRVDMLNSGDTNNGGKPDNFVVLHDPSDGSPVQYDDGSGSKYWGALNNEFGGTYYVELFKSTSLDSGWTWDSTPFTEGTTALNVCDFVYLGGEAGAHDDFWLFLSRDNEVTGGTTRGIELHTSDDMSTWNADGDNPVFGRRLGGTSGNGPEDFRIVKVASSDWRAVYEHDGITDGTRAIGKASNSNSVPSGNWTNDTDDLFGSDDKPFNAPDEFLANPTILKHNGLYWCFYEASATEVNCCLLRTTDDIDSGDWTQWGVVYVVFIPNCVIDDGTDLRLYGTGDASDSHTRDSNETSTVTWDIDDVIIDGTNSYVTGRQPVSFQEAAVQENTRRYTLTTLGVG